MKPVVIYTVRSCPFCVRAKSLLDSKAVRYTEVDVTGDYGERASVSRRTGHGTFPQIFIGEVFVGGCNELHALDRSGELDPMLVA